MGLSVSHRFAGNSPDEGRQVACVLLSAVGGAICLALLTVAVKALRTGIRRPTTLNIWLCVSISFIIKGATYVPPLGRIGENEIGVNLVVIGAVLAITWPFFAAYVLVRTNFTTPDHSSLKRFSDRSAR